MNNPIKILHVNKKKEWSYFLIREGLFIRSTVPRNDLKKLLKAVKPDLILADPFCPKMDSSPHEFFAYLGVSRPCRDMTVYQDPSWTWAAMNNLLMK